MSPVLLSMMIHRKWPSWHGNKFLAEIECEKTTMAPTLRKIPPVCLAISIIRLLMGKLRYSKKFLGHTIKMQDGGEFTIFRHITNYPPDQSETPCVFFVSFKFARLSHRANKLVSIMPMMLIAGFPGFVAKMYAVNVQNGYWQGMYQWKSAQYLDSYKKSFVFRMMNKRAIKETITSIEWPNRTLSQVIDEELSRRDLANKYKK